MSFILKLYSCIAILILFSLKPTAQSIKPKNYKEKVGETINKKDVIIDVKINKNGIPSLDTAFRFSGFENPIKVEVYLPKNYASNTKKLAVLYSIEGGIVNEETNKNRLALEVILDSLEKAGNKSTMVVKIDAGLHNADIYHSLLKEQDSFRLAKAYVNFLADNLKPFIDNRYRTINHRNYTLITGAALNANIAYFAFLSKNEIFGKAGLFSPSFEFAPALADFTNSLANSVSGKIFYYVGIKEDAVSQEKAEAIIHSLGEKSNAVIYNLKDTEGWASASFWIKYFPSFIIWALADGNNSIINIKN